MTAPLAMAAVVAAVLLGVALVLRHDQPPPRRPPWWWLVTVALCAAAGAALTWGEGGTAAATSAVTVLIAAAPGAVVAGEPLTSRWLRRSARRSGITLPPVLGVADQRPIGSIVLDKHRTITTGSMQITSVDPIDPEHRTNLLFFAGALARRCRAPYASALSRRAGGGRVSGYREIDDGGLVGSVDRHPVRLGPPEWVGLTAPVGRGLALGVEVDLRALGTVSLDDTLRPGAYEDAQRLVTLGPVVLVSDDTPGNTAALAEDVGLGNRVAEADSTARVEQVVKGRTDGGRVVVVAPRNHLNEEALAAADLAVTTASTDAAPLPGTASLQPFDLASAIHALTILEFAPARMRRVRSLAVALSLLGAGVAAAGVLDGWAPLVVTIVSSIVVAVASRVWGDAGETDRTCHVDAKFPHRSPKSSD